MVIYVPAGSCDDETNLPEDFNATARFLLDCGVLPLDEVPSTHFERRTETGSLFDERNDS